MRPLLLLVLCALTALFASPFTSSQAGAGPALYVVNSTADTTDGVCDSGTAGGCTLREAILAANLNAFPADIDVIRFNIPGPGVQTILVGPANLGALPTITQSVHIEGHTQPGASCSPRNLLIEIVRGAGTITPGVGLTVNSPIGTAVVIKGLVVRGFDANTASIGVDIQSNITSIDCSHIGTSAEGTSADPNYTGIRLSGSGTIGGTNASTRNIISGNTGDAVQLRLASGIEVRGNYIGTNLAGTAAIPNQRGVSLRDNARAQIGGVLPGEGNLISGNLQEGVVVDNTGATNLMRLRLWGNLIGTDATGELPLGNGGAGVALRAGTDNHVGRQGFVAGRNVISANTGAGVVSEGPANSAFITGNYIGLTATGQIGADPGLGNLGNGITLLNSGNNRIGLPAANSRNFIAGNAGHGISIFAQAANPGSANDNSIENNSIGYKPDLLARPNQGVGIFILASSRNVIGGAAELERNAILSPLSTGIIVRQQVPGDSIENYIRANNIWSTNVRAIDLQTGPANTGVTPNDTLDPDGGPNLQQNFPVLTTAIDDPGIVTGTLNSVPNKLYTLDFFRNVTCDSTGNGDTEIYMGSGTVMTDANGNGSFSIAMPNIIPLGDFITATAIDPDLNTSEPSACIPVTGAGTPPVLTHLSVPSVQAAVHPGLDLVIFGSGFESGATVDFGGTPMTPTAVTATSVTIHLDAVHIAGVSTRQVTVRNPTSGPSNALTFEVLERSASDLDCDGDVDPDDALLGLLAIADLDDPVPPCDGDANRDGTFDLEDVAWILRVIAGLIPR